MASRSDLLRMWLALSVGCGAYLALLYLQWRMLTADRFRPHPPSAKRPSPDLRPPIALAAHRLNRRPAVHGAVAAPALSPFERRKLHRDHLR